MQVTAGVHWDVPPGNSSPPEKSHCQRLTQIALLQVCICNEGHPPYLSSRAARQNVRGMIRMFHHCHASAMHAWRLIACPATAIFDLRSFIRFTPRQCKPDGSLHARLLRIFGLTAIYIATPIRLATAYIWPDGHLYGSRLGNASLTAFVTGSFCSFHETGGLLSAAE